MRETIRRHIELGVDQIKLSMSGEQITETRDAQDCYFSDAETAACVDEAHRQGRRLCAHARARDSVKMCVKHGVDIIYHASWIDGEGMEMLDKAKDKHIVAPGINWLITTIYESSAFGYSLEKAEQVGYKKELEVAIKGLREMHRRGITVLPGGDYGFAWCPHGTYARDLEHFVKLLDFTPMESIVAVSHSSLALMSVLQSRERYMTQLCSRQGRPRCGHVATRSQWHVMVDDAAIEIAVEDLATIATERRAYIARTTRLACAIGSKRSTLTSTGHRRGR